MDVFACLRPLVWLASAKAHKLQTHFYVIPKFLKVVRTELVCVLIRAQVLFTFAVMGLSMSLVNSVTALVERVLVAHVHSKAQSAFAVVANLVMSRATPAIRR